MPEKSSTRRLEYGEDDLVRGLEQAGLEPGDTVISHVGLGRLGIPRDEPMAMLLRAFKKVLGDQGTLLIPVYTNSFGAGEVFDLEHTPSTVGDFTEYFRLLPGVIRSREPMLSVAGLGPSAAALLTALPARTFGKGTTHDRLVETGAKLCMVGVSLYYATFRHHIEAMASVPFRYDKIFGGIIREKGQESYEEWVVHSRLLLDNCNTDGSRLDQMVRASGLCRTAGVGISEILTVGAREYYEFGRRAFSSDPWLTARGPALSFPEMLHAEGERVKNLRSDTGGLPPRACLLADDVDRVIQGLGGVDGFSLEVFPTGAAAPDVVIPEKWEGLSARLIGNGRTYSAEAGDFEIAPYSLSFSGRLTSAEIKKSIWEPPSDPFRYAKGLYPRRQFGLYWRSPLELAEGEYEVSIRTAFSYSTLSVASWSEAPEPSVWVCLCVQSSDQAAELMQKSRLFAQQQGIVADYMLLFVSGFCGIAARLSRAERPPARIVIAAEEVSPDQDADIMTLVNRIGKANVIFAGTC